jgi:sugar O-acyltransferase (sialic acid O-acetyltransferase NeuD family)
VRLAVVGAGGHSREVADLVAACGHVLVGFTDDSFTGPHQPTGLPIARDLESLDADAMTVAIGDVSTRATVFSRLAGVLPSPVLVHPSACVSEYAQIGDGTQVMQNVVVSAAVIIAQNVILNVGCFVAHDCTVGAHSHIAPGVLMSGGASVGDRCLVGAGAILLPGVSIGAECVVGAGAVVTRDVLAGQSVTGVPARPHGASR